VQGIELYEGEILYYELVGWTGEDSLIMPEHQVKDKELVKRYGKEMRYSYGTLPGQCALYIYRITRTSSENVTTELSWNQVKQRCNELGLAYVPELAHGITNINGYEEDGCWTLNLVEEIVNTHTEGPSTLCDKHIREGVVIRVESEQGTNWYKNKSFDFGVMEGYIKSDDDYIDREEAS